MKIVFFSHYYWPEGNAPASRTADHCARWVRDDSVESVTVITCAPNVPDGKVYPGYKNSFWPTRETVDGVDVIRVWTWLANRPGKLSLILNYVSYLVSALFAFLFFTRRPNVIVATSPQFFCGITGVLASWMKWCPLVLEIRDIWPESIVTVGALKRGAAIRVLEYLERWMYRRASHLVAVGPGYRDNILSKADVSSRISIVTNGVDPSQFEPSTESEELRGEYGLAGKFVCSYVGTVGMAHGLDVVVRAAEELKQSNRSDILFLVVGGGTRLNQLRELIEQRGLADLVCLTGRLDKSQMPSVLAASDVCLVHLSKVDLFEHVIPSKIFETMAMQRPIIMGVKGRARDIVLAADAGVPMEPENATELIEQLDSLKGSPERLLEMGKSGRSFVERYFNRDGLADDMLRVITRTAKGEPAQIADRDWSGGQSMIDASRLPGNPLSAEQSVVGASEGDS